MKIGILTQPLKSNYGGLLQNYALQKILIKMGHEPVTINIQYDKYSWMKWFASVGYFFFRRLSGHKHSFPVTPCSQKKIDQKCVLFIEKYISATRVYYRLDSNLLKESQFELLIVGSDQVWRPKYNRSITDMFFGFAKNVAIPKISYAASFGTDEWEFSARQTSECSALLNDFSAVSVREISAQMMCRQCLNCDSQLVPDPTALLTIDEYLCLCKNVPISSFSFIFVYFFSYTNEKKQYVKSISEKYQLPIVIADISNVDQMVSVEQWLSYIRDAKMVITDSYHGTLFSIYFGKRFVSIKNSSRGNARFDTLQTLYNLSNIITEADLGAVPDVPETVVDISIVKRIRFQGETFLQSALNL